jgi:hypothetical protein
MVTLDRLEQIQANVTHLPIDVKPSFLGRVHTEAYEGWQG